MKPDLAPEQIRSRVDRLYAAAIANGTHSEGSRETVCDGCRRWVKSIMYVTLDHKRLCAACAPKPAPKLNLRAEVPK